MELVTADEMLKEAEERLLLLEQKAAELEESHGPGWIGILLIIANTFMGSAFILLLLQTSL
ncbi:MAG: hypothetical protein HYY14_04240 [Candidatus Omnitrophica bacterium]|nr:hypothetical protein [Candidatus Omnitrophota bacterium]